MVGVCDLDRDRGNGVASEYGVEFLARSADLLQRVDAVSIAAPANSHFELASEALSNGVHTLVEKPVACTLEEADSLVKLEGSGEANLFVGHSERFSVPMVALRDRIREPLFLECHRLASFGPRGTDVAVVLDLMIHDIDLVLWLVGDRLEKLDAVGVPVLTDYEDIANVRLEFTNGCVANLTASRVSKEPLRKTRIFQRDEYISIDSSRKSVEIYARFPDKDGQFEIRREEFPVGGDEPLKAELRAFLHEVNGQERTSLATGSEGREALAVALGVLEQMRERRRKIESN